jgi:hypothetical protein
LIGSRDLEPDAIGPWAVVVGEGVTGAAGGLGDGVGERGEVAAEVAELSRRPRASRRSGGRGILDR